MPDPVVIWDFDGTLALRRGHWADCLVEILDDARPGHGRTADDFRPRLQRGFRWHAWESAHEAVTDARAWWDPVEAIAADAYRIAGYPPADAVSLAARLRATYLDRSRWALFEDTLAALELIRRAGWRNAVLSNHCPELPDLIRDLGLDGVLEQVFNSATTGFEKPHPGAYRTALDALGRPAKVWMIGDQPRADVGGAEAAGIPAILVRTDAPAARHAATALEAARLALRSG